jgi:hypothetical protein
VFLLDLSAFSDLIPTHKKKNKEKKKKNKMKEKDEAYGKENNFFWC